MAKFGFEAGRVGDHEKKPREGLKELQGRRIVRAKVDPMPARSVPDPLPCAKAGKLSEAEYHRVMSFAEEYGLLSRERDGTPNRLYNFRILVSVAARIGFLFTWFSDPNRQTRPPGFSYRPAKATKLEAFG